MKACAAVLGAVLMLASRVSGLEEFNAAKSVGIQGTYNTTFLILPVPESHARSLLPASHRNLTFLPTDQSVYPKVGPGQVPLFLELGREQNTGPPGLSFLSFQEAKVEVLQVKRLASSNVPFLYKHRIFVDDYLNAGSSYLLYGLNTTVETFSPKQGGAGTTSTSRGWSTISQYQYEVKGKVKAVVRPGGKAEGWELAAVKAAGASPWFADFDSCAAHSYQFNPSAAPLQPVVSDVTLYPPFVPGSSAKTYKEVRGARVVVSFNITLPGDCSHFAAAAAAAAAA